MFKILGTYICWKKYIKCNIWRVAVRLSYKKDARFLKVNKDRFKDQQRHFGIMAVILLYGG